MKVIDGPKQTHGERYHRGEEASLRTVETARLAVYDAEMSARTIKLVIAALVALATGAVIFGVLVWNPNAWDGDYIVVETRVREGGVFHVGDRVVVSDDFFWARGASATIAAAPPEVTALSGPWDNGGLTRQEVSALGEHTVHWEWFDEPQTDADGDGPFRGGEIWVTALRPLPATSN